MSLLIKAKFWNKSNNVIIDYSDKNFTLQKKEIVKSGTLYRKGNNLSFKGRTIPQPHLFFKDPDNKFTLPINGIFRSEYPYKSVVISNSNIFFL